MPEQDFSNDPTPEGADQETPQGVSKRHFWSKPKVQEKPTREQNRAYEALLEEGFQQWE